MGFSSFPAADALHHAAAIQTAMAAVLERASFILGPECGAFEREFAGWLGAAQGVAVASGTDAIELMVRALPLGDGAAVVVPALTATASAVGVLRAGAEVVLADVSAEHLTLCPESLRAVLRSPAGRRVKAALVVHLHGHCAHWEALSEVAQEHGILLLEDAAQAHGAEFLGKKAGCLGTAAAFSFYPTKNLGALGDAGMVVTSDVVLAERVRMLREYGWQPRQVAREFGINSRMDELQAAVLRVKLPSLYQDNARRGVLAEHYLRELAGSALVLPSCAPWCKPAWHLFAVRSANRDEQQRALAEVGIPTGVHYPVPLHLQPGLAMATPVPLHASELAASQLLSLPLHPYLAGEDLNQVVKILLGA